MIVPILAGLLVAAIPQGEARYRFELGDEPIGTARLEVACRQERCTSRWTVSTRAPEAAGGAIHQRRVEVETDSEGRWTDGPIAIIEDGEPVAGRGVWGAVPVSIAEAVLARARDGSPCIDVFDERSGEAGKACGRRGAFASWELEVKGVGERVRMGASGLPTEVVLPAQRARFVLDARAEVPLRPPRLYGVTVPGPAAPAAARRFCGTPLDAGPPEVHLGRLPAPAAEGASCREKTAHWLAAAARAGFDGRTAVGVAWDGSAFSWHSWAEVRVEGTWVAVDPSFGQAPARGPRFTLGRWADAADAAAARAAAGRRVLECWGRAIVE